MNIVLVVLIAFAFIIIILLLILVNRLATEVVVDAQSGLKNYRWFQKRLQLLIKKNKKNGIPFSIAILDIDNFRRFNKIGIEVGDDVLYEFATHLNNLVVDYTGTHDVVRYRLGDEFAIIFLNSTHEKTKEIANRILETFKNNFIKTESHPEPIYITFKFGIAEYKEGSSMISLLKNAETDLANQKSK
jgi:diguanylate cyclase (GGDEF)-like protein